MTVLPDQHAHGEPKAGRDQLDRGLSAVQRQDFSKAEALWAKLRKLGDEVGATLLQGHLAEARGEFRKAAEIAVQLTRRTRSDPGPHALLGKILLQLGRDEDARAAAQRALDLQPRRSQDLNMVGVVLSRTGQHHAALACFAQLAATDPSPENLYNHAVQRQFCGDIEPARQEYRNAVEQSPEMAKAWHGLALLAPSDIDDAELAMLEEKARCASPATEALLFGHAAAAVLEQRGCHEAAMNLLAAPKAACRVECGYSEALDASLFAAATDCAERTLECTSADPSAVPSEEPLFIVGMPRTGTTLLDRMLSSHPGISSAGELGAFSTLVNRAVGRKGRLVLTPDILRAAITDPLAGIGAAYSAILSERAGNSVRKVDKMPLNFFYVPLIRRVLPNARILLVLRDPRDTAAANYMHMFSTSFPYYHYNLDLRTTAAYTRRFQDYAGVLQRTVPEHALKVVRYEDLVMEPSATIAEVLSFCGVPWSSDCLSFHMRDAPVSTASAAQVRRPLYRSSISRWTRYGAAFDAAAHALPS